MGFVHMHTLWGGLGLGDGVIFLGGLDGSKWRAMPDVVFKFYVLGTRY